MNLATLVVLAVVVACVILSIRTFRKKGTCGYKDQCGNCAGGSCGEGCSCSDPAKMEKMIARANDRLAHTD